MEKRDCFLKGTQNSNKLVLYNTLSTILLYAITFFSAPIFSRLLGTENYGVVQVYNTWISFFTVVVGLYTRGTLSIAKVNYDEKEYVRYQSSVLFLSIVAFLCFFALIFVFKPFIVRFFELGTGYLILMLFHSFGVYCVYFINARFTYEMKARTNLIISVTIALANFGLSYLLVEFGGFRNRYTGRIIGMVLPYIIAGVAIIIYILKSGRTLYNKKYWKFCLPLCLPLIFHGLSGIICAYSDRVMIQKMLGFTAVGIYSLAYNFANITDSIWGALHNSWDPFFFEYVKNGQYYELKQRSYSYIRLFTCLLTGFILISPEFFFLFASEEYWEGVFVIPVIVMSVYAIFMYSFASNYEFCFKRTDVVALGSVISGVANIILNILFINWFGYFGAAIATLFSNIILAIVHTFFVKKLVKERWVYNIKMFIAPIGSICVATVVFYAFFRVWMVRWILAVCVGIYMVWKIYKNKAIF